VIGILYSGKSPGEDEELFLEEAKKKDLQISFMNIFKKIDEKKLRRFANKCNIIYNTTAEDFSIEIVKTFEELGVKIIESSESYYSLEDKWVFYLKCKHHRISTPKTILLSENINIAKKEIKEFGNWPVVLKETCGTMGENVEKANNMPQVEEILRKFWKKKKAKFPIIAQEYIKSPSYRVTLIGNKIVQTALKDNKHGWKATGVYAKKCGKFKVDWKLRKIITNLKKFVNIEICGIDLLKRGRRWFVLEVNSQPAFDFVDEERRILISQVLDFLEQESHKKS
jgi:RimK family alpha-L-glutamate ligase